MRLFVPCYVHFSFISVHLSSILPEEQESMLEIIFGAISAQWQIEVNDQRDQITDKGIIKKNDKQNVV